MLAIASCLITIYLTPIVIAIVAVLMPTVPICIQLMEIVGKLWDFKHQNWVKCCTPTWRVFTKPVACVTGFAQRGLIHASNFSNLRKYNSTHVWSGALKFGSRTFLSHYVYKRKFYFNNLLPNEISYASSKFQITCVYKILFHKSGHTSDLLNLSKQSQMSLNNYICDWILENRPKCHIGPIPFYWPS